MSGGVFMCVCVHLHCDCRGRKALVKQERAGYEIALGYSETISAQTKQHGVQRYIVDLGKGVVSAENPS